MTVTDETKTNPGGPSRRRFLGRLGLAAGAAGAALTTAGQALAQSVAWQQAGNNNHILDLAREEAASEAPGKVVIDFFGHSAFRITTPKGLTLAVDPWRNDPSGAWGLWFPREFPRITVDIGLSTHAHFDHDALDRLDASALLDRLPGTWSFADVSVTGIADKHSTEQPGWYKWINAVKESGADPYPPNNPGHLDNVSYIIETGGLRILIWGDNRHNPPEEVWQQWGRVDILTLPVDGSEHILSFAQADEIIERLKPKLVIPVHYLNSATTSTLSTLQDVDAWVAGKAQKTLAESPRLELEPAALENADRAFHHFGNQAATA